MLTFSSSPDVISFVVGDHNMTYRNRLVIILLLNSACTPMLIAKQNTVLNGKTQSHNNAFKALPNSNELTRSRVHERNLINALNKNLDSDFDGIADQYDNCYKIYNPTQNDFDNDFIGDRCDLDIDGDSYSNQAEQLAYSSAWDPKSIPKPNNLDNDNDQIDNTLDNCPNISNYDQGDKDQDNIGNPCDPDIDGDGYSNKAELQANTDPWDVSSFPTLDDQDKDGIADLNDNCPHHDNTEQWDKDGDGLGNKCDPDIDGDGFNNDLELLSGTSAWDASTFPNTQDDDGDSIANDQDNCPNLANIKQKYLDNDGIGNACDKDIDGDGFFNSIELSIGTKPWDLLSKPFDTDKDGIADLLDNCPNQANQQQLDLDRDGLGNKCDNDMDGDRFSNQDERKTGTDPANALSYPKAVEIREGVDIKQDPCSNENLSKALFNKTQNKAISCQITASITNKLS